jgi:hypothetical protein
MAATRQSIPLEPPTAVTGKAFGEAFGEGTGEPLGIALIEAVAPREYADFDTAFVALEKLLIASNAFGVPSLLLLAFEEFLPVDSGLLKLSIVRLVEREAVAVVEVKALSLLAVRVTDSEFSAGLASLLSKSGNSSH